MPLQDPTAVNPGNTALGAERRRIVKNLKPRTHMTTYDHAKAVSADVASRKRLNQFLRTSGMYDAVEKRWRYIPQGSGSSVEEVARAVYEVVCAIVNDEGLGLSEKKTSNEDARTVVYTRDKGLLHAPPRGQSASEIRSSPSIVIKATGSSFETPSDKDCDDVGYTNAATCINVGLDSDEWGAEDKVSDAGICAKQTFIQQPNRKFARFLYVTETTVTFIHFDRAGAQYTPTINIHSDPYTFIRYILGLSSYDERALGLDTSIKWIIFDGKKVAGTLTTYTLPDGNVFQDPVETVYTLVEVKPVFMGSQDIVGKGTTCWIVCDPKSGRHVIVKDSWRSMNDAPECEYLELARGVQGVVQVIAYEETRAMGTISDFRGEPMMDEGKIVNGWAGPLALGLADIVKAELVEGERGGIRSCIEFESRLVLEAYGPSLEYFESEKQLLGGLRDAIAAHSELLLSKGVVHRDISANNIVLPLPGRKLGEPRATLINLEFSMLERYLKNRIVPSTGTRIYQSIASLRCTESEDKGEDEPVICPDTGKEIIPTWHDHLDDLESFLYILAYIVCMYELPPRKKPQPPPKFIYDFRSRDPAHSADAKLSFVTHPDPDAVYFNGNISGYWSTETRELLKKFRTFICEVAKKKESWRKTLKDEPQWCKESFELLRERAPADYASILEMFDTALRGIEDREARETEAQEAERKRRLMRERERTPISPVGKVIPKDKRRKRRACLLPQGQLPVFGEDEDQPTPKRARCGPLSDK